MWDLSRAAYTTAHGNTGSFNPLSKTRDRTRNLVAPSRIHFRYATVGIPLWVFLVVICFGGFFETYLFWESLGRVGPEQPFFLQRIFLMSHVIWSLFTLLGGDRNYLCPCMSFRNSLAYLFFISLCPNLKSFYLPKAWGEASADLQSSVYAGPFSLVRLNTNSATLTSNSVSLS